ncbi:MAG: hypothetical protein ACLP50_14500 [Solirubrobacteraceae bacterium]
MSTCSCSPRRQILNAALRDSEARAQAVLQNVADGIVTVDEGGLIESPNQSALRLSDVAADRDAVKLVLDDLNRRVAPANGCQLSRLLSAAGVNPRQAPRRPRRVARGTPGLPWRREQHRGLSQHRLETTRAYSRPTHQDRAEALNHFDVDR